MAPKLSDEIRAEIVLLSVNHTFSEKHHCTPPVSSGAISKIVNKFKATGSVKNRMSKGRPRTAVNTVNTVKVLKEVKSQPHSSIRQLAKKFQISVGSVNKILKAEGFHAYKMQFLHKLNSLD